MKNFFQMAMYEKDMKGGVDEPTIHRIRITLTSGNVKSLEKGNYFIVLQN